MPFRLSWMSRIQSFPIHQMQKERDIFYFVSSKKEKRPVFTLFLKDKKKTNAKRLFGPHFLIESWGDFVEFSQRINYKHHQSTEGMDDWQCTNDFVTSSTFQAEGATNFLN